MVRKCNSFGRSTEGVARRKVVAICRFTRHLLDGFPRQGLHEVPL